jgi:hypothetical protein
MMITVTTTVAIFWAIVIPVGEVVIVGLVINVRIAEALVKPIHMALQMINKPL